MDFVLHANKWVWVGMVQSRIDPLRGRDDLQAYFRHNKRK
jgi:hypothetical protein